MTPDPSFVSEAGGWLIGWAVVFVLAAAWLRATRRPTDAAATEATPPASARRASPCTQRGCPGNGIWWVRAHGHPDLRRVCGPCLLAGQIKGYWGEITEDAPYDQEQAVIAAMENDVKGGAA